MNLTNLNPPLPPCIVNAVTVAMANGSIPKVPIPFRLSGVDDLVRVIRTECPDDMVAPGIPPIWVMTHLTTGTSPLAGTKTSFTVYPTLDVLGRLVDYKLPLVVLLLQAPHAPLGTRFGGFARLHLFANPWDSLGSYMFTLFDCYAILVQVRQTKTDSGKRLDEADARALALVMITYATEGRPVGRENLASLVQLCLAHPEPFRKAARSLATDRSTSLVPMMAALFGFVAAIVMKYIFIDHKTYDKDDPQAIQLWSLSSSMTVIWATVAVELAAIIGAHQNAESAAKVLDQLEEDLLAQAEKMPCADPATNTKACLRCKAQAQARARAQTQAQAQAGQTNPVADALHPLLPPGREPGNNPGDDAQDRPAARRRHMDTRITHGVIGNFRPGRSARYHYTWAFDVSALGIVTVGSVGATRLAWRVPPEGWNCRTINKLCMFGLYLFGGGVQQVINRLPEGRVSVWAKVWYTTVLDLAVLLAFAADIFVTQFGAMNCPECYVVKIFVKTGVQLPSATWETVKARLAREYPGILFGFLALHFVMAMVLWFSCSTARHMLIGESEFRKWVREKRAAVKRWWQPATSQRATAAAIQSQPLLSQ